jgi:hypothetical protein
MILDLHGTSFEEFVRRVFDHPVEDGDRHSWYDGDGEASDVHFDPDLQIVHLTRLFGAPRDALGHLSPGQIQAGFWFIGGYEQEAFLDQLWNPAVSRDARAAGARAIPRLYAELFLPLGLEVISDMFGDFAVKNVCDFEFPARRGVALDVEPMRDVFLDVFTEILAIPDRRAWYAALHGLGHLRHERAPDIARAFLETHAVDDRLRAYAGDVIQGKRIL